MKLEKKLLPGKNIGFGIRPAEGKPVVPDFTPEEIEYMAEMEHGRWNIERLSSGWKYGTIKNEEQKRSPFLIPWNNLPDEVKNYDRLAVLYWAEIFSRVGLEIYRLPKTNTI